MSYTDLLFEEDDNDRAKAFRHHLDRLALSQRQYATLTGYNVRSVRRWASGDQPIPSSVMDELQASEPGAVVPPDDNPIWTKEDFTRATGPEHMSAAMLAAFPKTKG